MRLKFYPLELAAQQWFTTHYLLKLQQFVLADICICSYLLIHILYFYWFLQKIYAQIEFFPKLIIRVPHNGLFDA